MVARYQWQKYFLRTLAANSLRVQQEDIRYISQAGYHLDSFIRPGPHHSIFVQDYQMCAELLQSLIDQAGTLQLSEKDKIHLHRYLVTALKLHRELGTLLEKVKKELTRADFAIIPMPGCFMYEPEGYYEHDVPSGNTYNINFLNSLSGWSSHTKNFYYITTGATIGDGLGKMLMDTFSIFMQRYVPNIDMYFVGRDANNINNFSEPMSIWNDIQGQSGVHCYTFEMETADVPIINK